MQQLEALTREARALATGLPTTAAETEVARQMQICNACRYCEGFCAVFPAMTRRLDFNKADIHYLANLCHNCSACLYACQYAPPHEFAVNVPQALAVVRGQTYADYAWPPALGALYQRNGLTVALATAGALALFLALVLLWSQGSLVHAPLAGNFYAVFPHKTLVAMFGLVFVFAIVALGMGVRVFWTSVRAEPVEALASPSTSSGRTEMRGAAAEATKNALTLKYLDGGHAGSSEAKHEAIEGQVMEAPSHQREGVAGFVAALAVAAVEILEGERVFGCLCRRASHLRSP
jgi:citrate/tricarballylate utilization protein